MAKKLDNQRNIQLKRILTFFFTFLLAFLILMTAIVTKKYNLNPGDIANADIKAPRDTIDQMATKAKEDEVVQQIDKQYTLKTDVSKTAEDNVRTFFKR